MGMNGTTRSVVSDSILKGKSESAIMNAITNESDEAKKLDPKNAKKAKKAE